MKKYFKILERHFGNHSRVADELGITPIHYRRVRNGHHNGSETLKRLVKMLAEKVQSERVI